MRRSTITIPEPLAEALEAYQRDQEAAPSVTAVVQTALERFLADRGYLGAAPRVLGITPALRGSGTSTTSEDHDAVLAESILEA